MPQYTRFFNVDGIALAAGAHSAGDTLFVGQAINALSRTFRGYSGRAKLEMITVSVSMTVDPAMLIYIFDANPTLGAADAAFGLTNAEARDHLIATVAMGAAPAVGAGRHITQRALGIPLIADNNSTIYIAAATTGTPTPGAAATCNIRLGVLYQED